MGAGASRTTRWRANCRWWRCRRRVSDGAGRNRPGAQQCPRPFPILLPGDLRVHIADAGLDLVLDDVVAVGDLRAALSRVLLHDALIVEVPDGELVGPAARRRGLVDELGVVAAGGVLLGVVHAGLLDGLAVGVAASDAQGEGSRSCLLEVGLVAGAELIRLGAVDRRRDGTAVEVLVPVADVGGVFVTVLLGGQAMSPGQAG